jgi:ribosomal protein S18 acetylase RimI-like enzyme
MRTISDSSPKKSLKVGELSSWSALPVVQLGAVRRLDAVTAESKRMYVVPEFRGRGVARRLLAEMEGESVPLGVARLVLETGIRQPEALALYERAGFVRIPAFGEYVDSPLTVCMAKDFPGSTVPVDLAVQPAVAAEGASRLC